MKLNYNEMSILSKSNIEAINDKVMGDCLYVLSTLCADNQGKRYDDVLNIKDTDVLGRIRMFALYLRNLDCEHLDNILYDDDTANRFTLGQGALINYLTTIMYSLRELAKYDVNQENVGPDDLIYVQDLWLACDIVEWLGYNKRDIKHSVDMNISVEYGSTAPQDDHCIVSYFNDDGDVIFERYVPLLVEFEDDDADTL